MLNFLLGYAVLLIFVVFKTRMYILNNELFWLTAFWALIFGVYYSTGVTWGSPVSVVLILYLILCFSLFLLFRIVGQKRSSKIFFPIDASSNVKAFSIISLLGIVFFSFDFIYYNGLVFTKANTNIADVSFVGDIANLFVPVSLVIGLFLFCKKMREEKKISVAAVFFLLGYMIPCVIRSGREAIVYALIALISAWAGEIQYTHINNPPKHSLSIRKIFLWIGVCFILLGGFALVYLITRNRFTDNEVTTYLYSHIIPNHMIEESNKIGPFKILYFHVASYFGHQLPYLELILKSYDGPYILGMYELNIISRRLPDFLGLDYQLVRQSVRAIPGSSAFSGCWQTVIGSFIFDFGKIFTPVLCGFLGYVLGRIRRKFKDSDYDIRYNVLIGLICMSMFATIQLGPFYSFNLYGTFIWWFIIFKSNIKFKFMRT